MHKTMVSVVSLKKIEIIRSQEFMPSEARLKFLKKMIILGPKTAILGPQFCRILVLGPHFWWSEGGPGSRGPPDPPLNTYFIRGEGCTLLIHPGTLVKCKVYARPIALAPLRQLKESEKPVVLNKYSLTDTASCVSVMRV